MTLRLDSGAQRSERARGYHMLPVAALQRWAERMDAGAEEHGEYNWHQGIEDPEWVRECFNHALEHLLKWRCGDNPDDDHLAAAMCGLGFLLVSEERAPEAVREAFRDV